MARLNGVRVFLWTYGTTTPDLSLPSLLVRLAVGWGLRAFRSAPSGRSEPFA